MPFVGCCALVYFWTLRFSRIGDFWTLRLGFFGNLDLRIIYEKDSIFISNLYADMSGCIGSNLKEAEPNAERFHRYYAQSNR